MSLLALQVKIAVLRSKVDDDCDSRSASAMIVWRVIALMSRIFLRKQSHPPDPWYLEDKTS